nr:MAG TPA: hypothetical protein [Caudoviricetes sp.]
MIPKYENTLAYAKATGQVPLEDHEMMYFADWLRVNKAPIYARSKRKSSQRAIQKETKSNGN